MPLADRGILRGKSSGKTCGILLAEFHMPVGLSIRGERITGGTRVPIFFLHRAESATETCFPLDIPRQIPLSAGGITLGPTYERKETGTLLLSDFPFFNRTLPDLDLQYRECSPRLCANRKPKTLGGQGVSSSI